MRRPPGITGHKSKAKTSGPVAVKKSHKHPPKNPAPRKNLAHLGPLSCVSDDPLLWGEYVMFFVTKKVTRYGGIFTPF